jgi:site-specific recombinase XerD
MAKTEKLSYHNAKKYANDLWLNCENETDTRLKLSNRMMGLVLLMGLETGARISDLLKMKYSDIEEMRNKPNTYTITFRVEKSKANHKWLISADLKGKIDGTREYMKTMHGYYGDVIFFNPTTEKQFSRVWASKRIAIANRLGKMGEIIKVAGSHSLRKASAHHLFERSKDLRLVQTLLKHKNIATTSKYLGLEEEEALSKAIHVLGY